MRKEDKNTIIEQIAATVQEYGHFYLVDTTAMNAAATSELRRACFKADIKLMVVKNTLLHKALESIEGDFSPLYDSLKGTTAVMFCNVANAPAKLIKDKSKDGIPGLKAAYAEENQVADINSPGIEAVAQFFVYENIYCLHSFLILGYLSENIFKSRFNGCQFVDVPVIVCTQVENVFFYIYLSVAAHIEIVFVSVV